MRNILIPAILITMTSVMIGILTASAANQPESKMLIDYGFFDSVKTFVVKLAIELFLVGKTLNQTINFNHSGWIHSHNVSFTNLTITQFDMDWKKSHFLVPGPNNGSLIQIRGLNLTFDIDFSITASSISHTDGRCSFSIFDLNTDIGLGFSPTAKMYVSILSATLDFGSVKLSFDSTVGSMVASILNFIFNSLSKSSVTSAISFFLTRDASNQIQDLTINGINIPRL